MPIAANRYYNDPTLGQAFNNLASIFAPPSGSDLAGYATANAKKEEAARLAELFRHAQDPDTSWSMLDRLGIGAGVFAPNQSLERVDRDNATQRYGYDTQAQTTLTTNAADNERALATNTQDNQRALIAAIMNPVSQGQIRPGVGAEFTDVLGLPAVPEFAGAPKPLSETEWQAQQNARLQGEGQLTDQMMLDSIMGERTPVQAVGPEGTPVFMSPGAAVREGAAPAPTSTGAPETQNYQTPDGARGTAVFDPTTRQWLDTATGQPVPQGSITFNSSLQGGAADTGLGPTTANSTLANSQASQITSALNTLDIYENLIRNNPGAIGLVGLIRGTAQNAVASAQDLAAAFGKSAPQVQSAAEDIREGLSSVAPELFDPSIPEANFLQGTIAYAIARTENPSGEVSRQAYDRAIERISGGMLANSQSALANVGAYRRILEGQLQGVGALRDPATARTDTNFRSPPGSTNGPTVVQTPQGPVTIQRVD